MVNVPLFHVASLKTWQCKKCQNGRHYHDSGVQWIYELAASLSLICGTDIFSMYAWGEAAFASYCNNDDYFYGNADGAQIICQIRS
jgi:hypothetical protein